MKSMQDSGFDGWSHDLLRELEQQTSEAIRKQRSAERQEVQCSVRVRSGNASQASEPAFEGVTGDVSPGGCRIMTQVPVRVGDIYKLEFAKGELDLPIVFARCLRCRLVREDAFESGYSFFTPIKLDDARSSGPLDNGLL